MMAVRIALLAAAAVIGLGLAAQANDVPKNNFPYTKSKCVGTPIKGVGGVQFDRVEAAKRAGRELREHGNRGIVASRVWNYLVKKSRIRYHAFIEEQCRLRAQGRDYQFNRCHPEFESLDEIFAGAPGDIYTWTGEALAQRHKELDGPSKAAYKKAEAACN